MDNEQFIEAMEWELLSSQTLLIALKLLTLEQKKIIKRLNN